MARRVLHLSGEVEHLLGDAVAGLPRRRGDRAPPVDPLRPRILLAGGMAQGAGHVAHRRAGPVGDHVGHLGRVVAAVLGEHVLDDLLAAVALDVDVDVGRPVALGRQEALEQEAEPDRVGLGDVQGVADRRVGGAAPALAQDVLLAAEADEVPDDEEVAGEPELLDDRQLPFDRVPGLLHEPVGAVAGPVEPGGALLGEPAEVLHLVEPVGTRERWQRGSDERQVERHRTADLARQLDHARIAGEAAGLLGARTEVGARPPPAATASSSARLRRERTAAKAVASRRCAGVA